MRNFPYRTRPLRIEPLEDRRVLSAALPGDLLLTIQNPGGAYDHFGAAVASVGDKVLVGAPLHDMYEYSRDTGIAYLFDGTTGALLQTFPNPANPTHPDLANSDTFGASVAIVGENILIGAPMADVGDLNDGAVYLFDGVTGDLLYTFENPYPGKGDQFGSTLLAVGDDILIGARFDDPQGVPDAGSVYLFDGETYALLQEFPDLENTTHPVPSFAGELGSDMAALGEDGILIASPRQETVFLFQRDALSGAWNLEKTIQNPEPMPGERFGQSVAVAGDKVAVGTVHDGTYGHEAGVVYLFDTSTDPWTWRRVPASETMPDPALTGGDHFGVSATAIGDNFVIGADQPFSDSGVVYWIDSATGEVLLTIENPEPAPWDQFGYQVAALGDNLVVGAPLDDAGGEDAGIVYVFQGGDFAIDTPPTLTPIADQTVNEDTSTGPLGFTVGDEETDPGLLVVTASSSDQARIPDAGLILGGSGAARTIEVVPAPDQNGGPVTITLAVSDGTNTTVETFLVSITTVNDAPSFALATAAMRSFSAVADQTAVADQSVAEDAGPQSVPGFVTQISPGPADESGQALTFLVLTDNPGLFAVQPAIDPVTGELTYTPAADAHGVANVTVRLTDDGGTANGGVDTSPTMSFTITIGSEKDQIGSLLGMIADLHEFGFLNDGQSNALSSKLNRVLNKLDRGKTKAAVNQLGAFVNQVQSLIDETVLTQEQGALLIGGAEEAIKSILTGGQAQENSPEKQEITALTNQISDLGDSGTLSEGEVNALSGKLTRVLKKINRGKSKAAVNQLRAFSNQVNSLVAEGTLNSEEGQMLVGAAGNISSGIPTQDLGKRRRR